MVSKASKRLDNEFKALSTNPVCGCVLELTNPNDLHQWSVYMKGPEGTPYEKGVFLINFKFPDNYPFKHPEVNFVTPMYHPNIKKDTGEICMDVFASSWCPTQKAQDILEKLISMLRSPSTSSPLEADICKELINNPKEFDKKVRDWVKKHSS